MHENVDLISRLIRFPLISFLGGLTTRMFVMAGAVSFQKADSLEL